jgi:hypothetical protein
MDYRLSQTSSSVERKVCKENYLFLSSNIFYYYFFFCVLASTDELNRTLRIIALNEQKSMF